MKTNMKNPLIKALLATFACLTFGHVTAYAAGGSSGNGNGDSAFAFQALIDENPGLDDMEILKKAFDESAGRLPEIVNANDGRNKELLAFKSEVEKFNGVLLYRSKETGEIISEKMSAKTFLYNLTIENGPLLSPSIKKYQIFFNDVNRTASMAYLHKTGVLVLNKTFGTDQRVIEIRQFNPKILIYAIFATKVNDIARCIYNDSDFGIYRSGIDTKDLVPGQICAIAYSWKSN